MVNVVLEKLTDAAMSMDRSNRAQLLSTLSERVAPIFQQTAAEYLAHTSQLDLMYRAALQFLYRANPTAWQLASAVLSADTPLDTRAQVYAALESILGETVPEQGAMDDLREEQTVPEWLTIVLIVALVVGFLLAFGLGAASGPVMSIVVNVLAAVMLAAGIGLFIWYFADTSDSLNVTAFTQQSGTSGELEIPDAPPAGKADKMVAVCKGSAKCGAMSYNDTKAVFFTEPKQALAAPALRHSSWIQGEGPPTSVGNKTDVYIDRTTGMMYLWIGDEWQIDDAEGPLLPPEELKGSVTLGVVNGTTADTFVDISNPAAIRISWRQDDGSYKLIGVHRGPGWFVDPALRFSAVRQTHFGPEWLAWVAGTLLIIGVLWLIVYNLMAASK
jgi:hypothetical protein